MIAHNPLHGSGRAALPHPALALGDYAATARDARAVPLGTERSTARFGSGARRNTDCAPVPPLAAICPGRGWVRACVAEVRLSPRSASLAVSCVSFAATP